MNFVEIVKVRLLSACSALIFASVCLIPHTAFSQQTDYAIEVAALRSKDCAVELANGLLSRGFDAYWLTANQPEYGVSYRVRVGKFKNLDIARNYAENLLDSGLLDTCAITVYETPLYALSKASSGSQNRLPSALSSLPVNSSCPINISDNNSSNPEDLLAAISKNKWLLSSSQSVVYSLPPKRSVSTARDVVVLMRSVDRNRWRLKVDVEQLMAAKAVPGQKPAAVDLAIASTMSSMNSIKPSVNTAVSLSNVDTGINKAVDKLMVEREINKAVNKDVNNNIRNTGQLTTVPSVLASAEKDTVAGINRPAGRPPIRNLPLIAGPRLQATIELRDGQLMMKLRNLDRERSFSGLARITLTDDKDENEVAPLPFALEPAEERIVPLNEARMAYGEWMLMVFDERQAVQLIRSAPFGQRPQPAAPANQQANQQANQPVNQQAELQIDQNGQPIDPNAWKLAESSSDNGPATGLPNVTGVYDATKSETQPSSDGASGGGASNSANDKTGEKSNPSPNAASSENQVGQVLISPRQVAVTNEAVTMELDISAQRPLGYIKVTLRAGNYVDEKFALLSSSSGRVPFLVPLREARGDFSYEIKNESGTLLGSGANSFSQFGR